MKNIILSGLMGCGKSSVAKELSLIFETFELIDTDFLIEKEEKLAITEIFSQKGEEYFRKAEKRITDSVLNSENQIVSLGGGTLENKFNWELAKEKSIIFYLKTTPETLYNRIKNDTSRPLLQCNNPQEKLKNLLATREKNYLKADYVIETDNLNINETAIKIKEIYTNATNS